MSLTNASLGGEPVQSAVIHQVASIKRRSKNIPQRDDDFIRELRQFMKEQYYTQSDLATSLNCSQVCNAAPPLKNTQPDILHTRMILTS